MKGKLPLFLILSGAIAALLSAFVILYFNMIGVEPAFFKAFYTDLVPHRAVVPLLLLSLLGGWILLQKSGENASKFARALLPAWLLFLLLILSGIGVAPFWPTAQVYGVTKMPELDSTMLYIYFSAMGIPGCGIFTWLMGYLGDHFGLKGAILVVPACLVLFCAVVYWECWVLEKHRSLRQTRRAAREEERNSRGENPARRLKNFEK